MGAKPTRELPDIPADQLESVKTRLFAELNSDLPPNIGRLTQIIETNDWRLTTKTLDFLKSEYEYTPLHAAVAAQKVAYVEYFLERGCRARVGDRDLNSPLHTAVSSGNEVLVDLLLEYGGVDLILASNMKGNTPLHEVRVPPLANRILLANTLLIAIDLRPPLRQNQYSMILRLFRPLKLMWIFFFFFNYFIFLLGLCVCVGRQNVASQQAHVHQNCRTVWTR
jgi:hypothetical protein